ncbi:MAG: IS110 family transposase [Chloroflexota bacterium]|nr:IS110 family transposase [Chloroflexota bacterium]
MPTAPTHRKRQLDELACVHPNAAGLDIGSEEIVVAVPPERDSEPVRVFPTFTVDLHALVAWLVACGIDTVALESTGVFWIPIYELLEQAGITPYLVNARHVKTVPGRKTDWNDAQWLQKLHALGLLQGSFRPDAEIRTLRTLARYRAELIERRAPHINHMIQALKHMNIQLNLVLTDITGVSGLAMLRAIIAGERDPKQLATFRQPGCKHAEAEIVKALTGTWDDAQLFILKQSVELFDYYTTKLIDCDTQLEQQYQAMESRWEKDAPLPDLPPAKGESKSKNAMTFNARAHMARVLGVDLVAAMGLSAITVQTIVSEVGTDMDRFPTVKHFCSWLGLAPRNDISGGKILRSRTMKVHSRANQAFRQAAHSVTRSHSSIGAYYRAMRARLGPKQAIVATAHKIARVVYHLLKTREPYRAESAEEYDQHRRERELKHLARRAQKLGYTLTTVPTTTPEVDLNASPSGSF